MAKKSDQNDIINVSNYCDNNIWVPPLYNFWKVNLWKFLASFYYKFYYVYKYKTPAAHKFEDRERQNWEGRKWILGSSRSIPAPPYYANITIWSQPTNFSHLPFPNVIGILEFGVVEDTK